MSSLAASTGLRSKPRSRSPVTYAEASFAACVGVLTWTNTGAYLEDEWRAAGQISIALTLALPGVLAVGHVLARRSLPRGVIGSWVALTLLCALLAPRAGATEEALVPFVQAILVTSCFAGCSVVVWPDRAIRVLSSCCALWCLAIGAGWLASGMPTSYSGYFENPNTNGSLLVYALGLSQLAPKRRAMFGRLMNLAMIGIVLLLVVATLSRSALLALFVGIGVYVIWPLLQRSRLLHHGVFAIVIVGIAAFVTASAVFIEALQEQGYADYSDRLTGKTLTSREVVWGLIVDAIYEQPLWGHGGHLKPSEVIGVDLSSHCLYLQTGLNAGLVGVVALLITLGLAWSCLYRGGQDPVVRVAGAILLGMLVHQTFEVALLQNHLAIGVLAWLSIGIGVSRSTHQTVDGNQRQRQSPYHRIRRNKHHRIQTIGLRV